MRKFDTKVQHLKYKVLREVARFAWKGELLDNIVEIPKIIISGNTPPLVAAFTRKEQSFKNALKWQWVATERTLTLLRLLKSLATTAPLQVTLLPILAVVA